MKIKYFDKSFKNYFRYTLNLKIIKRYLNENNILDLKNDDLNNGFYKNTNYDTTQLELKN